MSFTSLMDGGLSVRIGGVERAAAVNALEWESTLQGDAGASFWLEVADPFNPQAQYPELLHGAPVTVEHTYAGLATRLYTGWIVSDPRRGYAGEVARVAVECGGPLEVAKGRSDFAYTFTDADTSQWLTNKRSPRCHRFDNAGRVAVGVADNVKVPYDRAGMIGAVAYLGAQHLARPAGGILPGYRRITGAASWDLKDHMKAALLWWPGYKVGLDASDYHVIHSWGANTTGKNRAFDYAFASPDGAGYVALALWCNKRGGYRTTDERFIELDDVVLYTDVAQKRLDEGMVAIAQSVGLASSYASEAIGSLAKSLLVRPHTDPASALATLAALAPVLVEWGWWGGAFRARPLPTDPAVIRALPNCYRVDASCGDVIWDVALRPDSGTPRAVRLIYGHTGKTKWPAGTPAQVVVAE